MSKGKRTEALEVDVNALVANFFASRILPFDREAALAYGALVAAARAVGRAVSVTDGQIGAIASVHGFTVATRDTAPFIALGVPTINPWDGPGGFDRDEVNQQRRIRLVMDSPHILFATITKPDNGQQANH